MASFLKGKLDLISIQTKARFSFTFILIAWAQRRDFRPFSSLLLKLSSPYLRVWLSFLQLISVFRAYSVIWAHQSWVDDHLRAPHLFGRLSTRLLLILHSIVCLSFMQWSIYSSRLRYNVISLEIFPDSNFQTNVPFPTNARNWTWFSLLSAWFTEFSPEFLLTTFGLGSSDLLSPLFTYPAFPLIREPFSGGLWTFQTFWCSIFGVTEFLREAQYFTFWSSWSFKTFTWPSVRVTLCTDCCPRWGFQFFILSWKVLPQAIFCSFLWLSSNQFI